MSVNTVFLEARKISRPSEWRQVDDLAELNEWPESSGGCSVFSIGSDGLGKDEVVLTKSKIGA